VNWGPLLIAVIKALFGGFLEHAKDISENASVDVRLRDRLRSRVREVWKVGAVVALCFLLTGCFTRTIYVPDGTPVRLREPLEDVKVWVLDSEGKPVASKMDLWEGWYCLPDPGEPDE